VFIGGHTAYWDFCPIHSVGRRFTQINADNTFVDSLSETVLSAVFEVSNTLGAGFLEKVYQRALVSIPETSVYFTVTGRLGRSPQKSA